jgi:hypothetical protein
MVSDALKKSIIAAIEAERKSTVSDDASATGELSDEDLAPINGGTLAMRNHYPGPIEDDAA